MTVEATKVVVAKKEVTYGTDSAPAAATNAILTRNFSAKPVETDRLDRNLDRRTNGSNPGANSNERQTVSYEVELAGSGTAGTAAPWMELLEACGMDAPVLTAVTKAEQKFSLPGVCSSLTQHHWKGSQRRKSVGVRGTFSMDFTAGAYPFAAFNWTGLIPASAFDVNAPAGISLVRWKAPVEVNSTNTDVTLDGFAVTMRYLRLSANAAITVRNLVGSRYIRRGNHALTGTLMIEAPSQAVKDYLATRRGDAMVALVLEHGTVAGNIVGLDSANVQITDITESEEDDLVMWELALQFNVVAGQDDLLITAK